VALDTGGQYFKVHENAGSGSMVYVFAPTCTALDQYLEALKKLEARIRSLDGLTLLVGHHYQERTPLRGPEGKQLVTDVRTAAEKVLRGELDSVRTYSIAITREAAPSRPRPGTPAGAS
jgi:hypothetical protein